MMYSSNEPQYINNTKQHHCFLSIVSQQPVRLWQTAFKDNFEIELTFLIRKENGQVCGRGINGKPLYYDQ